MKDLILITLLFGALIGCWYAYQQKKSSQKDLHRMMKDMESLHNAELELKSLQKEFEIVKMEQESVTTEKQNLEKRLRDESMGLHASSSDLEVSQLKAEIEVSHTAILLLCFKWPSLHKKNTFFIDVENGTTKG